MISQYKELIDNNADIIWEVDTQGTYTYINNAVFELLGYTPEEMIGKTPFDFMPEHEKGAINQHFKETLLQQKNFHKLENTNLHKNGHVVILETSGKPIFDKEKKLIGYIGVDRDITDKKKLQEDIEHMNAMLQEMVDKKTNELKEILTRYDFAIDGSDEGLWDWNILTDEVFYSKRWKKMQGYEDHELGNTVETWSSLLHPDDYEMCMKTVQDGLDGKLDYFEDRHRLRHKDGSWVWVLNKGKTFFDSEGKPIRMAGFHTDITESVEKEHLLKERNRMLKEQAKMAAMGEMISNIAHQWRQPLSLISTISSGIKIQKELNIFNNETLFESMDKIQDSVQYLSHTIDDFRTFFIPNKEKVFCNIEKIIKRTLNLVSAQFSSHHIEIITDVQSIEIEIFENELIQGLINILNNARDELVRKNHERVTFIKTELFEDDLVITITDNAGGVPITFIEKIFDPYFTTKENSQGTGIGLYMTKEVIEEHLEGQIEVKNVTFDYNNETYTGAEFKIILKTNT